MCNTWLLKLNVNKCKVASYSRKWIIDSNYYITQENTTDYVLEKIDSIKDLRVIFDSRLNFVNHMQNKINKAYSMIGIIKRNFININVKKTVVYLQLITAKWHVETAKIMNGDITLEAIRRCHRASKVISPFIIFAVFDVSFRIKWSIAHSVILNVKL